MMGSGARRCARPVPGVPARVMPGGKTSWTPQDKCLLAQAQQSNGGLQSKTCSRRPQVGLAQVTHQAQGSRMMRGVCQHFCKFSIIYFLPLQ